MMPLVALIILTNMVSLGNSRLLGAVTILAYSVVPLIGVLTMGWDWREILVFYWLGNISAGFSTIIDILHTKVTLRELVPEQKTDDPEVQKALADPSLNTTPPAWVNVAAAIFFTTHYGMFTLIHGIFLFAIVTGNIEGLGVGVTTQTPLPMFAIFLFWLTGAAVQLFVKARQSSQNRSVIDSTKAAYSRMFVLHLSIIFGTFLIVSLQLPAIAAVLLIVVNAIVDLRALRSTRNLSPVTV